MFTPETPSWQAGASTNTILCCQDGHEGTPYDMMSLLDGLDGPHTMLVNLATALQLLTEKSHQVNKAVHSTRCSALTIFHGMRAPPISVEAYLERILKYADCSPICFLFAYVYIIKLAERDTRYNPTKLNLHRLFLTAVLIAVKFVDDRYYNNATFAKVGGVSLEEINRLELKMLTLLEFRVCVSAAELRACAKLLGCGSCEGWTPNVQATTKAEFIHTEGGCRKACIDKLGQDTITQTRDNVM